eukprot:2377660-Heterocapsa_arctica.AAC.1
MAETAIASDSQIAELLCDWDWKTSCASVSEAAGGEAYEEGPAYRSDRFPGSKRRAHSRTKPVTADKPSITPFVANSVRGELYPVYLWIPSKDNPSDAPSRMQPLWCWLKDARSAKRLRRAHQGKRLGGADSL